MCEKRKRNKFTEEIVVDQVKMFWLVFEHFLGIIFTI